MQQCKYVVKAKPKEAKPPKEPKPSKTTKAKKTDGPKQTKLGFTKKNKKGSGSEDEFDEVDDFESPPKRETSGRRAAAKKLNYTTFSEGNGGDKEDSDVGGGVLTIVISDDEGELFESDGIQEPCGSQISINDSPAEKVVKKKKEHKKMEYKKKKKITKISSDEEDDIDKKEIKKPPRRKLGPLPRVVNTPISDNSSAKLMAREIKSDKENDCDDDSSPILIL